MLARCATCAMVYVRPIPPDEFLQAHYQDAGYFEGDESQGYRNYADMRKALLPHFMRRLRAIDSQFPARGKLLDYGCAAGYFLELAGQAGWQISGVELSDGMARQAEHRLAIPIARTLADLPPIQFDAITLWEVIEHLPQPVAVLRQLFQRLRPGGALVLSTPNTGHWQALSEPDAWPGYRPPSHLLFFTQTTLEETLRRAGFERLAVQKVSPLPRLPGWLRRLSRPLQRGLADGQARAWPLALWTWRGVRVAGWGWARVVHPRDDVFTTLEAFAFKPG